MIPIQNDSQFIEWIKGNAIISTLKKEFIAGTYIQAGQGVFVDNDGKVYPYNTFNQSRYVGVAEKNSAISCVFTVVIQGYLKVPGADWIAAETYYMNNTSFIQPSGDFKVAIGIGKDEILIYNQLNFGGSSVTTEGYAKSLMLMGG